MAFTLYQADQMPMVKVQSLVRTPLKNGLTQITAVIVNEKLAPTHAAVDVKNKITPPDRVSIAGRDLKVLVGMTANNKFFNGAVEQDRKPQEIRLSNIRGMSAVYIRWIVRGKGPFAVTVRSVKGGVHSLMR